MNYAKMQKKRSIINKEVVSLARYQLKKKDMPLIEFELNKNELGDYSVSIVSMSEAKDDYPEKVYNNDSLLEWLRRRMIPRNRTFVEEILSSQGLQRHDLAGLLDVCLGLSVNDVYWVTRKEFTGTFREYNLYENSFSEALSLVAFTGYSDTIKELSPSPEMTTNGMLPKCWRRIDSSLYLYKGGTNPSEFSKGGNEPYTEYYAAQVAEAMGIEHVTYNLEKWKNILASTCRNFTSLDHSFVPIGKLLQDGTLTSLVEVIKKNNAYDSFKDMILLDAVLLNEDRHFGNFGFLKNNETNQYEKMAPLFDHGISLLSHLSNKDILDNSKIEQYIKDHSYSALGRPHDELVSLFCSRQDIRKLRQLFDFHFKKHDLYNFEDERLQVIESFVQERSRDLIRVIEQNKTVNLNDPVQDTIRDELFGYQYEYRGDDENGGICKIYDSNEGFVEEFEISKSDLEQMDAITFIENKIEVLAEEQTKCR